MAVQINGTTGITTPKLDALDLELGSRNVVERGSNANGEYVRFADGTQICRRTINLGNLTIGANGISVNIATTYGAFPASFVSEPARSYSQNSGWSYAFLVADEGVSNSAFLSLYIGRVGAFAGPPDTTFHTLSYILIGRWY